MQEKLHSNSNSFSENNIEKQQAFLLKLSDTLRPLANPGEIEAAVTKIAMDFMDADWCHYSTIVEDKLIILRDAVRGDLHSLAGEYKISSFALFKAVLDSGQPFIVDDVHTTEILDEELKQLCGQLQNISFIIVPVIKNGKPAGMLTLVQSKPRKWTNFEVHLTIETAERTWAAVERAKAEEALCKSEEKYRTLFTSIDQGFVLCELVRNKEGKGIDYYMLELNPTYETQTGISAEMVLGKTILQVFPTIDKGHIDTFAAVVDNQCPVIFEQYFEVNHRWHEVKVYPGEKDRFTVLFSDISERKKAGEKIEESKTQLQNIFLNAPAAIAIFEGPQHKYILANKAYEKLSNRKASDLLGKSMQVLFPELIGTGTLELYDKVLETGESFSAPEYALMLDLKNEGVLRQYYFNFSMEPLKNSSGEIYAVLAVTYDITEQVESRKKIEESDKALQASQEALKINERQLQNVFHATTVAIGVLEGPEHKYTFVNPVTCQMLHQTKEELLGKTVKEVFPEVEGQGIIQLYDDVYNTGNPFAINELSVQIDILNNGISRQVYFNLSCEPLRDSENKIYAILVTAVDVTEQVESRKKIEESEKRFQAAISAVEGIIWTNNASGEMVGEQTGWSELTGQSFEEYQGFGWANAIHPDDAQPTLNAWNDAVKHKRTFVHEHRVKTINNALRLYAVKAVPVFNETAAILEWVGVHTDITEQRADAQRIKESEERFRSLADQSPMIVYIVEPDPSATVSYFNETWLNYTGQSFEKAIGRAWDGIVHPDDLQTVFDIYVPAFEARQSYTLPAVRLKRFDGEYRWHMFKGNPHYLANNVFNGFIGVGFDIHEQKVAEEKLAYRTALLEAHNHACRDGILLIDDKGKIISFNRRFVEIWNIPKHIVKAKDDEAVLSFAMTQLVTPQLFIDRVKLHCKHQTETILDELEFKDGKIIELNGYSVIGEDAKYYAWSWTFRDITLQKNYEKAIIESEKLLEQKVIERTEQLAEKNIELQKMNKELEAFTYVSSHDLQEPLRKIQTFAGRILATENENLSENAKEYVGRMQISATRMQALIQDLLAFSRVSTSERKFEITNLKKIVDEVKEEFKESIEEKNAAVTTGEMCEVNIIPFQFRQIMHNLISNALKFSKQDVPLIIRIESKIVSGSDSPLGGRKVCHITVTDNGIGFEKKFSEKIFEVFQKLHVKEKYAGTGIGLAIVKKIVENHNGMVTTESELGKGTRFNIYIPARQK